MKSTSLEEAQAVRSVAERELRALEPEVAVGVGVVGEGFGLSVLLPVESKAEMPLEIQGVPLRVRRIHPAVAENAA